MKFLKYFLLIIGVLFLALIAVGIFKTNFESKASIQIKASQSQVFAVYNNPLLYKRWMSNFEAIEQVDGKPNTIGNKNRLEFTTETGEITTLDQTLTQYKPPELVAYNYENQWLKGSSEVHFSTTETGTTRIEIMLTYSGQGIVQNSLLFLMGSSIDQGHQTNLEQLKVLIEESAPDSIEEDLDLNSAR